MHTWRGIQILVIFVIIGEKQNLLAPPPCARDAETYKRRMRAGRRASASVWTKRHLFLRATVFADKFISICFRWLLVGWLFWYWTVEQRYGTLVLFTLNYSH